MINWSTAGSIGEFGLQSHSPIPKHHIVLPEQSSATFQFYSLFLTTNQNQKGTVINTFFIYRLESEGYHSQEGIAIGFQTAINQSTAGGSNEFGRQSHGRYPNIILSSLNQFFFSFQFYIIFLLIYKN